jgi:hypothetical protein
MKIKPFVTYLTTILACGGLISATAARADDDDYSAQTEPLTLLINYQIASTGVSATSDGTPYYIVGGPGYVPEEIYRNGIVSSETDPERQIATLEGAHITFSGAPTDPVVNFTCIPGSCKMIFKDGSVLVSNAGVQLEGRAINMWGPVYKAPSFDPVNGIIPIRILGCGGLKEVAGKGRLAGMVGSVCFNGILNFNMYDQTQLTGGSKCTITMHTPLNPDTIP